MTRQIIVNPDTYWTTLNDPTLNDVSVEFGDGVYGDPSIGIWLPTQTYAGPVTIRPLAGSKPQIAAMGLGGKVTMTGFTIAMKPTTQYGITAGAPGTVISGNKIGQGDGKTFAGTGVWLRNSRDISVVGIELCFLGDGVVSLDCLNILVEGNSFHDIASNATFHSSFKGLKVRGNTITDMRIQPDSSHPDAIQWASTGDTGRSSDLEVSGNIITRGTGDAVQGAFGESVDRAVISGNAMHGTMLNGISVSDSSDVEIRDNFGQGMTDSGIRIIVRGGSKNVMVEDNVFGNWGEYVGAGETPGVNIVFQNNSLIATTDNATDLDAMNAWLKARGADVYVPVTPPTTQDPPPVAQDPPPADSVQVVLESLQTALTALTAEIAGLKLAETELASARAAGTELQVQLSVAQLDLKAAAARRDAVNAVMQTAVKAITSSTNQHSLATLKSVCNAQAALLTKAIT